jgi:hypothetical protein
MKINNHYKKALKVKQQKEIIDKIKEISNIINKKQQSSCWNFYCGKEVFDKLITQIMGNLVNKFLT